MAADDLMYSEQEGKAIPMATGVPKVFAFDSILIGSAGIAFCDPLKYKLQDWITDFIHAQRSATDKRPKAVAEAIHAKMRETFEPVDAIVKQGKWKSHGPGERLVGYVVAGYTKTFTKPYIYEVGTEVNADGCGLRYIPPIHRPDNDLRIGEDKFLLLAVDGKEPQSSLWHAFFDDILSGVTGTLPNLPEALQDAVASCVSLIKVEAQFNPDKVGQTVNATVIDRASRQVFFATF
jgi:hypothetical protein